MKDDLTTFATRILKDLELSADTTKEIRNLSAEQSNTSVVFSDRIILKLFRRLQEGINPDLEIGRFLTRNNFPHLPSVGGAIEYRIGNQEPSTVVILQQYVDNQGDAWGYTLNSLARFFERVQEFSRVEPELPSADLFETAARDIPDSVAEYLGYFLESVQLMAERTAQMHAVLASDFHDPAFLPEYFSKLYLRSLYQSMRTMARRVLPQMERSLSEMPDELRTIGEFVLSKYDAIISLFQRVMATRMSGLRIRCHGDYHLGQILYTGKDFVIIDFEGEPAHTISERKIKRSPLRDVAGMLRSFHYAAYSAFGMEKRRGLIHESDEPVMEAWATYWHRWVSAVFLKYYLAYCADKKFLPETGEQTRILLDAFLMEKALYELGYEMNNRPDWVNIPIKGIMSLLAADLELPDGG